MGKSGSRGSRGFGYRPGDKRGGVEQGGGPGSGERWFAPGVCWGQGPWVFSQNGCGRGKKRPDNAKVFRPSKLNAEVQLT